MTTEIIYLVLQATYEYGEVGLYKNETLLDIINDPKASLSKNLIPHINTFLQRNNILLHNLSFIGTNNGPGPFTSLRVVITTINGISFATHIPLIGLNGLKALLTEQYDEQWPITVALLNAYNNDVYYAIQENNHIDIGCKNIVQFLQDLKEAHKNEPVRFIGQGVQLFEDDIRSAFDDKASIPDPLPQEVSLDTLAQLSLHEFKKGEQLADQLIPIYLKSMQYKKII